MDRAKGRDATLSVGCGQAADCEVNRRTLNWAEPWLWAEERVRGFEKATKSGVSLRYLGLRVAPSESGVNGRRSDFLVNVCLGRYRMRTIANRHSYRLGCNQPQTRIRHSSNQSPVLQDPIRH